MKLLDYDGLEYYNDKLRKNSAALPIGYIGYFPIETMPSGFLLCDGSAVNRELYSALFSLIGETYGAGNGVTTFNIPKLEQQESLYPCIKALFSVVNSEQINAVEVIDQIVNATNDAIEQMKEASNQVNEDAEKVLENVDQTISEKVEAAIDVISDEEIEALFAV